MKIIDSIKKLFGGMGTSGFFSGFAGASSWGRRDFLRQYKGYVYPCVSAIAEEVARVNFYAKQLNANGESIRLPRHQIIDLLEKPNPGQSGFDFLEMHQTLIELCGEAFWYLPYGEISKKPKEIWHLRPDLMEVAVDKETDDVIGYVLYKGNGTKVPFTTDEIIHFKMPNPINPFRGMGTIEAGMVYIQTEQATSNWTNNFIRNNARPAGIVSFNGKISKEDFEEVQRKWQSKYGDVKNAGKTAFVRNAEINFTQIGAGLSDIALKELKSMSKEDIMTMFRVSKPILGIVDDVNLANGKNAKRIFLENVVEPKMKRLIGNINFKLSERFGDNIKVAFDSPVPEDPAEKASYYTQAYGKWMGVNDIRRKENLTELAGEEAQGILVPMNLYPIGVEELKQPTAKSVDNGKMVVTVKTIELKKKINEHICKSHFDIKGEAKEVFRDELFKRQHQWEKIFVRSWGKELDRQNKEVIANLNKTKGMGRVKTAGDLLPNEQEATDGLSKAVTPNILELMQEQGQSALDLTGAGGTFAISDEVKNYVNDRVDKFVPEAVSKINEKLTDTLTEGFSNGESLQQLVNRVNGVYTEAKGTSSIRIARTETSFASNRSAREAYRQSGYITHKEWFANPDACEFCQEINGSVVGLNDDYFGMGDSFTGKDGGVFNFDFANVGEPPLHPNCECTIIPVIKEVSEYTQITDDDVNSFIDKQKPKVSDAEKSAVSEYQSSAYAPINSYLRTGNAGTMESDKVLEYVNAIDNAITNNTAKKNLLLYRGFVSDNDFTPGGEFVDNAFVSTSLLENNAVGFTATLDSAQKSYLAEIRYPKGKGYLVPSAISGEMQDEAEVILKRGMKYKVVSVLPNQAKGKFKYTKLVLEVE